MPKDLEQITTHEADAIARLLDQFKGSTVAELVGILASRTQDLENAIFPLYEGRDILNAEDNILDLIGKLFDVTRQIGESDDNYRIRILTQVIVINSKGTIPDVYSVLTALGATTPQVLEQYPYAIRVQFLASEITIDCARVKELIEAATAPIEVTTVCIPDGFVFGFDEDPDPNVAGFDVGQFAE